jgi:hypothetical protein
VRSEVFAAWAHIEKTVFVRVEHVEHHLELVELVSGELIHLHHRRWCGDASRWPRAVNRTRWGGDQRVPSSKCHTLRARHAAHATGKDSTAHSAWATP